MSLIPIASNKTTPLPTSQPTYISLQILSVSTILVVCLILGATLVYIYGEVFIPAQAVRSIPAGALLSPTKSIKQGVLSDIEQSVASSTTAITPLPDIFSGSAPDPVPPQTKPVNSNRSR